MSLDLFKILPTNFLFTSHIPLEPDIGITVRVGLLMTQVELIPKTQKMVLDATLLNTQHY